MPIAALAAVVLAFAMMTQAARADEKRTRELVRSADGEIDVIVEGAGPLIVLLPSRGRDCEDYDEVAQGLAQAGFRVCARTRVASASRPGRCRTSPCTITPATSPA
jgi:hypothetical protein